MKTSVKHTNDTHVMITITLGKEELDRAEKVALTKLARTMKVPGFRKGHVPVSVAVKHADPVALTNETVDNALSRAVADGFAAENLQPLDRPEVEVTKFVPGKELEFTTAVDILPKVKLGNYKKLGVKTEKVDVASAEVDEIVERLRVNMAEKKQVDRSAMFGDEVTIDFVGKKAGVAFEGGSASNYTLELGSNSFIPGFEEGLVGKKVGDSVDLKLTFPESYHVADLAGKDVVFETTVNEVKERLLPKLDDEFAAKTGNPEIKTLKDLEADIKRELLAQKEREAAEKRKDALVGKLVEISTVPLPDVLVEDQIRSIEQDMMQNLMYQNITLDNYFAAQGFKDKDEWMTKEVRPAAVKRVQAGLALAELTKELGITASKDEIEEHVNRYKQGYANNPEMLKRFDDPEVQRDIANRLVTEKTVDELVALN